MCADNTRYSFWQFIEKYEIKIPLIQRDYVQGKESKDEKTLEKRQEFIEKLFTAITEGTGYHVDFVYGAPSAGDNGKEAFIPLDGQQRLTTLFLMHWLLVTKSSESEEKKRELMKKLNCFTYETRNSSSLFCKKLAEYILPTNLQKESIPAVIREQNWFSEDWNFDPTICNCLSMLEAMSEMLEAHYQDKIDTAFSNLFVPEKSITFDLLDMREYKLTDGLYIKMNARGKDLTDFEHWKAHFIQLLEDKYPNSTYKAEFTDKIEHDWADCFWGYVDKKNVEYPVIDGLFMKYFNYLTSLLFSGSVNSGDESVVYNETFKQIDGVYSLEENVIVLFESLDFIAERCKYDSPIFEELFHHGDSELGSKGIRLFSGGSLNLLKRCITPSENDTFDLYEKILLYGILRYGSLNSIKEKEFIDFVRVLRNLLLNTNQINNKDLKVLSNLRINKFGSYRAAIELLINQVSNSESVNINSSGLANDEIWNQTTEYLNEESEDKLAIYRWLEDLSFTRGNIAAFKKVLLNVPNEQVYRTINQFNKASTFERVKLLISAGYAGKEIGYCKYGYRYFFGENDRWDVVFSKDSEKVLNSITRYVEANKDINDFIASNIPANRCFRYYALKYNEILRSAGYWQDVDNDYSWYYFAVVGDYDDLDMISLKRFSSNPLLSYHTEPFASAVRLNIVSEMPEIAYYLRNDSRYSDKATLHYLKDDQEVFAIRCINKEWHIENGRIDNELINKYHIENNILRETEEKDLIVIATDFVRDYLSSIR